MQSQILPSREALAHRIALQFSYGQNLIHVVGGAGYGKSYLLEHFITDHYEEYNKAYVLVSTSTSDADVQTQLLEHSFSYPLIDVSQSLRENFLRLHDEQGEREILWVIDNAKHLSQELIAELEWLAINAPCTLYILCASSQGGLFDGAIDIHLEPLTPQESLRLMGFFYETLPPREDLIFSEFLDACNGNPALLLQWQRSEQQMPKVQANRFNTNWIIAFALLCVITLIGAVVQFNPDAQDALPDSDQQPALVIVDLPRLSEGNQVVEEPDNGSDISIKNEEPASESASNNTVEHENESILTTPPQELVESQAQVETPSEPSEKDADEVAQPPKQQILTQTNTELNQSNTNTDVVAYTQGEAFDHPWYQQQNDDLWVWQLTIISSQSQLNAYLQRYQLQGSAKHYFRADKGWYVVTWSPAATKSELDAQRGEIANKISGIKPYAKQIRQIKVEINSQPTP
ncbi:AAA family ATPase [Pseudoalteromonas sp. SSDWG2]|uniref:AAA family ATPase n=1 Tax=Pseudoalteromonas sp. SSDWG2 TaxID=3139391 RepID=UPI003BA86245